MVPERSEAVEVEQRSFKTVREVLSGHPLEVDPHAYTWTDVELTHFVGGLVRRFSESWKDAHERNEVALYRPYFLGELASRGVGAGARRVEGGVDGLVSITLMLIQLHHLQSLSGRGGGAGVRELIEPLRFGTRRSGLDGPDAAGLFDELLDAAEPGRGRSESPESDDDPFSAIRARYHDLGWLMEGAIAPAALPFFADWLLERVFVVDVGPPEEDFVAELERAMAEPDELGTAPIGANPFAVRLRPSVEGGQRSIDSFVAATAATAATAGTAMPASDRRPSEIPPPEDENEDDAAKAARDVISYLVGAAFGQWDVRIPAPENVLHGKFEDAPPALLVDEAGHRLDIEQRLYAAARVVLEEDVEEIIAEAMRELGHDSVRAYLRAGFFNDHLKRYSRSRRQAPIYWPLSVPSRQWTVWLYAPRLTREVLVEAVDLAHARMAPPTMLRAVGSDGTTTARRTGRSMPAHGPTDPDDGPLLVELADFVAEGEHLVTIGWVPDLDDGAVLCAAPLADLCPSWPDLHRYRQELKAGSYPWASVARWAGDL